ncbi:MAG TPA: IS91 family transposase [Epulopiscium sp.]|nr:IS91 family transposase [Candidatus Epulonipiscium sp.]
MSYQIQDVFTRFYKDYLDTYGLDYELDKVARAIISCKTAALGGNINICDDCGSHHVHYNSCRNRHCPCCQGLVKEKWIDKRKSEVVNAPYFHIVFTVPSELNPLFYTNKKLLYGLLYKASAETLTKLSKDPRHLGAEIGFMSILHTWGESLSYHPHLHCIVLGGGLTKELRFLASKDDFLFPIRVVSRIFRGKFLDALNTLYRNNSLTFTGGSSKYRNSYNFKELLSILYKKEWIPHIKEAFKGASNVIEYLGRYTHKVAISNARVLSITPSGITFRIKDYKNKCNTTMILDPVEFIRRFLMHVLPKGFVRIRHYGILSNRSKKVKLQICRNLVKGSYTKSLLEGLSTAQIIKELFNIDISCCPNCGSQHIKSYRLFHKRE